MLELRWLRQNREIDPNSTLQFFTRDPQGIWTLTPSQGLVLQYREVVHSDGECLMVTNWASVPIVQGTI